MKFTGIQRQSRMVAGLCVPDGDYDELLREALRVALGITDPCDDDFVERYDRIIAQTIRLIVVPLEEKPAQSFSAKQER